MADLNSIEELRKQLDTIKNNGKKDFSAIFDDISNLNEISQNIFDCLKERQGHLNAEQVNQMVALSEEVLQLQKQKQASLKVSFDKYNKEFSHLINKATE